MRTGRRDLLKGAGALAAIPVMSGGTLALLTPSEAYAKAAPFGTLTPPEVATLEAFGELLLPGARAAGIAHFIDHHLSVPPAESLLMLRYLDVPPPYAGFYRAGLAALDAYAAAVGGAPFASLPGPAATGIVRAISAAPPPDWRGPPSPLFYFAVRSDAVDVVYGTEEGFEKLGVPYMAHILPETKW